MIFMKRIVTGILAHVDAGKTTCIESMLYTSKTIRKLGRVDHQDAYLDYDNTRKKKEALQFIQKKLTFIGKIVKSI